MGAVYEETAFLDSSLICSASLFELWIEFARFLTRASIGSRTEAEEAVDAFASENLNSPAKSADDAID